MSAEEGIKRDRWGRPLIVPPGGSKAVGYTRATTLAKTLEDEGGLSKWMMRMTALGLAQRPDLYALVATAGDDKGALDRICEDAKEAAGGSARANLGTALHAATETVDRAGGDLAACTGVLAQFASAVTAYRAALDRAGITTSPRWVERFVVLDDWQVAGTFDRLMKLPDGRLVIADLKTGADLRYSWRSIAVQLAVYAHGELYDPDTHERTALPDLDLTTGVVMHLPAGEDRCDLYTVDLVAGWEAAERSMWTRRWRKADVATPIITLAIATVEPDRPATAAETPVTTGEPAVAMAAAPPPPASLADQRDRHRKGMLVARCQSLAEGSPGFKEALNLRWPSGVPGLRADHVHTAAELDMIERAVVDAAAAVEAPFDQPTPPEVHRFVAGGDVAVTAGDPFDGLVGSPPTYAGATLCAELVKRLEALPPDLLADVEVPLKAAGVPNLKSGKATLGHLAAVEEHLAVAEAAHAERAARVVALITGMEGAEAAQLAGWATKGRRTLDRLTEGDVYTLEALIDCIAQGIAVTTDPANGSMSFSVDADTLATRMVAAHQTRAAALVAARSAAADLGLAAPRSVAQAAEQPAVAARVIAAAVPALT